ncbi:hypothetical protein O6H91_13G105800 [Diphasiastrum complanatum]|nr:hypothetical protein O6H91_13G105800 [Diphasiastrum complanatum]
MDITKILRAYRRCILPPYVDNPVLEKDSSTFSKCSNRQRHSKSPPLQPYTCGAQHSESSAAYILWPPRTDGSAPDRAAYFNGLQKVAELYEADRKPSGLQAATLLDLMTIRAFHSKVLRRYSLGTALGFRTRKGVMTDIPAIIVFVVRKLHKQWLLDSQKLPVALEGPGGVWCDVDVVEFSYYGAPPATPKEQIYTELVEGLRGNDTCIGSGSQVASQETYGTLGAIVRSQTGARQVGFITNRHVAVDLDYPNQKMFHPLPPNLGPGVYLGAVERATSFITDDLWYGIFAGVNPETFVRADGAFIPFTECFDTSTITTNVKEVGEVGDVFRVDLQGALGSVVGKHVMKVGRSSGLTEGTIMAYAVEYNDEKGICFFTDLLIVGENKQTFDVEGDSGSLILLTGEDGMKPRPIGIIWGGTANRGRLKLRNGCGPESWTSGVDLGRLLDLLQVDLITSSAALKEALEENLADGSATDSTMGDSSSRASIRDSLLLTDVDGPIERTPTVHNENFLHFEVMRKSFQGDDISQGLVFHEGSLQKIASDHSDNFKYTGSFDIGLSLSSEDRLPRPGNEPHTKATRTSVQDVSLGLYLGERESKRSRSSS